MGVNECDVFAHCGQERFDRFLHIRRGQDVFAVNSRATDKPPSVQNADIAPRWKWSRSPVCRLGLVFKPLGAFLRRGIHQVAKVFRLVLRDLVVRVLLTLQLDGLAADDRACLRICEIQ